MKKTERVHLAGDAAAAAAAAERARELRSFQEAIVEFTDVTHIAGLLQRAWFLLANAGWAGTAKPDGWEASALAWRGEFEAWMKAMTAGPGS